MSAVNERVEDFIATLRGAPASATPGLEPDDEAAGILREVFTAGNCGNFAVALQIAFPEAQLFLLHNPYHVVAQINGRIYDIDGDVTDRHAGTEREPIDREWLRDEDYMNNYSFGLRGPML